jgi:hypothetical protein
MSTFPTAFWKKQPEGIAVAQGINITWETGLFWSRGSNVLEEYINYPIQMESSFPFVVNVGGESNEYYSNYDMDIWVGNNDGNLPYFGWYLTGGYDSNGQNENDLSSFHQSNPWLPLGNIGAGINNGDWLSGISLWNEADFYTASEINQNSTRATYNAFVQSGSATGTFNVSAAQAAKGGTGVSLYTTVSGLGEDFPTILAPHYNVVEFYLDSTKIGEGVAPQDGIGNTDYDQQQLKLYLGSDTSYSNLLNPDPNDDELGAPRGYPSEEVEQTTRTKYCTTDGQHTFVNAMGTESAGSHQIKIYASTIDGMFSSGAFVGFEFELT